MENKAWQSLKLSDFADVTMGQSPSSNFYNEDKNGYPFLQGNRTFGAKYPTFDTWSTHLTKLGKKGSVIMSVRAPVGDLNIAPADLCLGRGVCSITMKNGNNEFLYYLLKANTDAILSNGNGTVFASINRKDLNNLILKIPSFLIQKKIAAVLSAIDDKIELNNKISANLEEGASTLFGSFYRNLSDENAIEFGDDGRLGRLLMGQSPKGESYNSIGEGMPLLNGAADYTNMILTPKKYTTSPTRIAKSGDLIFCIRATIGLLVYADKDYCLGRGVASITNTNKTYKEFVYHIINNSLDVLKANANGSVIVGINKDDILKLKVKMPNDAGIKEFHSVEAPIFEQISLLRNESKKLAELRDALLPKLMSGEIDVSNVEVSE